MTARDFPLHSPAIVHGEVAHRRARPATHRFRYPAFCLRLPLSQLDALARGGIAFNAPGVVAFHERDHGPRDGTSLRRWIDALLASAGIMADGEVVLHAFPRMLGYVFNPVSFWVCHAADGAVRAVLAEVNNTFGERHLYLLAHRDGRALASGETLTATKTFHVSPFCEVRGHYAFRFHFGPGRWVARIDYHDGTASGALLETWISGAPAPLERGSARGLLWRYRWFTLGVIARIHAQALQLLLKRVPYVTKPAPPAELLTRE